MGSSRNRKEVIGAKSDVSGVISICGGGTHRTLRIGTWPALHVVIVVSSVSQPPHKIVSYVTGGGKEYIYISVSLEGKTCHARVSSPPPPPKPLSQKSKMTRLYKPAGYAAVKNMWMRSISVCSVRPMKEVHIERC